MFKIIHVDEQKQQWSHTSPVRICINKKHFKKFLKICTIDFILKMQISLGVQPWDLL